MHLRVKYEMRGILCALLVLNIHLSRCHDAKDFDDTILYKIEWPGSSDLALDENQFESLLVSTQDKEQYRCAIPVVHPASENEEKSLSEDTTISPVKLLSTIFSAKSCSYRMEAYWTYELCHGHHIKQYHEERDGKNIKIQEYFLGKWNAEKTKALMDEPVDTKHKMTKIDNVNYPYLEMVYTDGTLCDLNEQPRETKVRYVCYPTGKNEIYSLKETSSCNYEAVILTTMLCMHPAFLPEDSKEISINCMSMNGSPDKPVNMMKMELESLKAKQKLAEHPTTKTKEKIAVINVDKDGHVRMDFIDSVFDTKLEDFVALTSSPTDVDDGETPATNLEKGAQIRHTDMTPVEEFISGKNCLTGGTGWWKYEFCYGQYVRQFHIDKSGETSVFLGYFDEDLHRAWLKASPEKRPKPRSERNDISHYYQGGSVCDKTGEKRQTEVKLKCLANAPSAATVSMYLLEPKTCQYILVVESPLICKMLTLVDEDGLMAGREINSQKLEASLADLNIDNLIRYEND